MSRNKFHDEIVFKITTCFWAFPFSCKVLTLAEFRAGLSAISFATQKDAAAIPNAAYNSGFIILNSKFTLVNLRFPPLYFLEMLFY